MKIMNPAELEIDLFCKGIGLIHRAQLKRMEGFFRARGPVLEAAWSL